MPARKKNGKGSGKTVPRLPFSELRRLVRARRRIRPSVEVVGPIRHRLIERHARARVGRVYEDGRSNRYVTLSVKHKNARAPTGAGSYYMELVRLGRDGSSEAVLVGFAQVSVANDYVLLGSGTKVGKFLNMVDRPVRKGTGFFQARVDWGVDLARENGISRVVVYTEQEKLAHYYEGFGFVRVSRKGGPFKLEMRLGPAS